MADEARLFNRFVRPIYDAIDGRQYKAAIKLCQNKKVAALDIVQVLKAHCLERTGRPQEALDICRAVQKHKPTDETLLNTMGLVFRLCGFEHEMLPTYEHACAHVEPPNEELFQSLFVAYARKGDFLKQQQTALKMFKAFGKIKYVCWAALSMLLQVQHAGAPAKMLGLADKMLLKTMRDTKSDDGEALQLLVHILQLQDKREDALQVFDEFAPLMIEGAKKKMEDTSGHCHDHGCSHSHSTATGRAAEGEGAYEDDIELGPMQAIDRLGLEASLTKDVAQWKRSGDVYKVLLESYNADDWTYLTEFISARVREQDGDVASIEKDIADTLHTLSSKKSNAHLRGPWLALVHLQSVKLKSPTVNDRAAEEAALIERIMTYIDRFSTKTCCFSDLKQYFDLFDDSSVVSPKAKTVLVGKIEEMAELATADTKATTHDESTRKESLNRLHRRLFTLKSLRYLDVYKNSRIADLKSLVKSLMTEYEANAWLNLGATGGQREVQNTDDLLLLAAHTLIDVFQRDSSCRDVLVEAAALLEYGLDKSAYNFQMKLLLLRVYGYLGASEAMLRRYKELDIKHVQLDSLTYLVFDKLLQLGAHANALHICDAIRRQHRSTANDTPEYIARAYRLGVYSKVLDMTGFLREKMQNSHTLAIARGEALQFDVQEALSAGPSKLTELVSSPRFRSSIEELEKMLQQTLSCNQHRDVVVQWTKAPLVADSDAFSPAGTPVVECDRSVHFESSVRWVKLQLVVPKMLVKFAGMSESGDDLEGLAAEYKQLVESLALSSGSDAKAQLWAWSMDVVRVIAQVTAAMQMQGDCDALSLVPAVDALQSPLAAIRGQVLSTVTKGPLSAYALSTASLLLRDAGLWAGALLCAASKAVSKKAKKDDALAATLRAVVKSVQESLGAVESAVKSVEVMRVADDAALGVLTEEAAAAKRQVVANVAASHEASLKSMAEMLKSAGASMRHFLQK